MYPSIIYILLGIWGMVAMLVTVLACMLSARLGRDE